MQILCNSCPIYSSYIIAMSILFSSPNSAFVLNVNKNKEAKQEHELKLYSLNTYIVVVLVVSGPRTMSK